MRVMSDADVMLLEKVDLGVVRLNDMSRNRPIVEEADLPIGGRFFSKPYDSVAVVAAFRELQNNSLSA